jgi:hypothetical protein
MAQAEQISTSRRGRSSLISRFTITNRQLDEYEQSGRLSGNFLMSCRKTINETWSKINSVQEELEELEDEGKNARVESLLREYRPINPVDTDKMRVRHWFQTDIHQVTRDSIAYV